MVSNKLLAGLGLGGGLFYLLNPGNGHGPVGLRRRKRVPDWVLLARVHLELGRLVSNPRELEVEAKSGVVTLSGQVPEKEIPVLVSTIRAITGVKRVVNQINRQSEPAVPPVAAAGASWTQSGHPLLWGLTGGAIAFSLTGLLMRGAAHK